MTYTQMSGINTVFYFSFEILLNLFAFLSNKKHIIMLIIVVMIIITNTFFYKINQIN